MPMTEQAAEAEQPLRANYEEIARRRALLTDAEADEVPRFAYRGDAAVPREYDLPDQQVVLYSLSQPGFAPCAVGGNSAIRVYGLFETREDAVEHAQSVLQAQPETSMLIGTAREWLYAPTHPDGLKDAEAQIEARLGEHQRQRERDLQEYREHKSRAVEEPDPDEPPPTCVEREEPEEAPIELPEGARAITKTTLPASAQVSGQRVVVMSTLTVGDEGAFIFRVYGAFDTADEAAAWVSNTVAQRAVDVHVDLVAACRWAYPKLMIHSAQAPKERYRQGELENIIDFHRTEPERVQQYKDWRKKKEEEHSIGQVAPPALQDATGPADGA